jgi:hypothetical protein
MIELERSFNCNDIFERPIRAFKQNCSVWKARAVEWCGLADFSDAYAKYRKKAYGSALKSAGLGSLRLGSIVARCPLPVIKN